MAQLAKFLSSTAGVASGSGGGLDVDDCFSCFLYEGNGSTQTITNGIDLSGEGGLVTIKSRTDTNGMCFYDTERGANIRIRSHSTGGNSTRTDAVSSFNSNGFSLGSGGNENPNGVDQVAWTFRKAPKFFDVGTISFNSSGVGSYSHNLGVTPAMVIFKLTNTTGDWFVWHKDLTSQNYAMFLNSTAASSNQGGWATYTDTTVSFNSSLFANDTAVVYLFADHANDGSATGFGPDGDSPVISCGSYTGNGSTTGPIIDCGFEPQWLLVKVTDRGGNWFIFDTQRGFTANAENQPRLIPNSTSIEEANASAIRINSTGFQPMQTGDEVNGSGNEYIYLAIRRGGLAVPTSATDVFAISSGSGTDAPMWTSNFPIDMAINRDVSSTVDTNILSRLTGTNRLETNTSNAEVSSNSSKMDYMDGYHEGTLNLPTYYSWMWKRAPSWFDCVSYSGTQVARTIPHNLGLHGAVPEMMWVKNRDGTTPWMVYHSALGNQAYLQLNSTAAAVTGNTSRWNATTPTASVFSLGDSGSVNGSGSNYIAYLFASLDGVSKLGSYTGNGSTQTIDCGFSNGARFVLIKRTSGIGSFVVFDAVRGITTSTDPLLYLDGIAAERSDLPTYDINPHSSGFTLMGGGTYTNSSGKSYIFYAIAA